MSILHLIARLKLGILMSFHYGFTQRISTASSGNKIDVVIPIAKKDYTMLSAIPYSISQLRDTVANIFLVGVPSEELTTFCKVHNYYFIDENAVLNFSRKDIVYEVDGVDRSGWLFQQLLKLGAETFVLSSHFLVLDADTVLIKPHRFLINKKEIIYVSTEWHKPYRFAYQRLLGAPPKADLSFVCHMMIFNIESLRLLKKAIEINTKMSWQQAILSTISKKEKSCFSEYELYGNWCFKERRDLIRILPFYNKTISRTKLSEKTFNKYASHYRSLSFHSYIQ